MKNHTLFPYLLILGVLVLRCEPDAIDKPEPPPPILNVAGEVVVSDFTATTAKVQGRWEVIGDSLIIEYGFVWGKENKPLLSRDFSAEIPGQASTSPFTFELTELSPGTNYFVSVYGKENDDVIIGPATSFQTESDPCSGVVADPDMINSFAPTNGNVIPQGTKYTLKNTTSNIPDDTCLYTLTADTSSTWMIVEHRIDNFDPWDTVSLRFFSIDSIQAGNSLQDDYDYIFNDPGEYLITTFADGRRKIFERVETNNDHRAGARGTNFAPIDYSVRVLRDPNWDPVKAGFEPGEYVKIFRTRRY